MHHHAVALSVLLHIAPGLAHAQQHEADAYHWLNDFVLADVNGDTLLDIAATNHAVRTRIRLNQGDFTFAICCFAAFSSVCFCCQASAP